MSSGRLFGVTLVGGVNTTVYTAPSNIAGAIDVTVSLVNLTESDAEIRFGIVASGSTIDDADWFEYNSPLRVGGMIERSEISLAAGDFLVAYSDLSNVTVTGWAPQKMSGSGLAGLF
jgi:hypothetical protein